MKHLKYWKTSTSIRRPLVSVVDRFRRQWRPLLIGFALTAASAAGADLARVAELIEADRVPEARQALRSAVLTGDHFGWELLAARLNPDGEQLAAQARMLIDFAPDENQRCDLAILYAQSCLLVGTSEDLGVVRSIEKHTKSAQRHDELTFALARLELAAGKTREAEKRLRKLAKGSRNAEVNWQALYLLSEAFTLRKNNAAAASILSQFAARPENPYFAPACERLLTLVDDDEHRSYAEALRGQIVDHAPRFAALSSMGSPRDQSTVTVAFAAPSNRPARSLAKLFAVRVGDFDREADARHLHGRLLKQGYTVRLATESAGERARFVVDLGRFPSAADAQRFKQRFERQTQKTYVVVSL